ncbi:TPA: hypothetical protein DF272_02725 [Candidatus Falkowbacteria bacterium]|nr:hypothetical protein [Candidatus Falkowbacteria bacterium]
MVDKVRVCLVLSVLDTKLGRNRCFILDRDLSFNAIPGNTAGLNFMVRSRNNYFRLDGLVVAPDVYHDVATDVRVIFVSIYERDELKAAIEQEILSYEPHCGLGGLLPAEAEAGNTSRPLFIESVRFAKMLDEIIIEVRNRGAE